MEKENNLNVDFKEMFSNTQELNQILNCIGQDQFETEEILSTYEKNGNCHGVIFTARETETGKMQKIIIDAIYGEPNSTQVKELTYGIGAECDKRIILYTLGFLDNKNQGFEYEQEMTEGFIKINNDFGHDTYLINISMSFDESENPVYCYKTYIEPGNKRFTCLKKLPTKLEFEQAIFRIFYSSSCERLDYIHDYTKIEEWYEGCWHLRLNEIEFQYPVWNEDGLFMKGISKSDIGNMHLKWIKDNKMDLLERFFDNREIVFNMPSSGDSVISIKLWDKPFSYFTKAFSNEKVKIAERIRGYDGIVFEFLDNLFGRQRSDNEIIKDLDCIPEQAFMDLDKEISD